MTEQDKVSVVKEMVQMRDSKYLDYLIEKRDKSQKDLLVCMNGVSTRWLQGQLQILNELIFEIEGARAQLDKKSRPPNKPFF